MGALCGGVGVVKIGKYWEASIQGELEGVWLPLVRNCFLCQCVGSRRRFRIGFSCALASVGWPALAEG